MPWRKATLTPFRSSNRSSGASSSVGTPSIANSVDELCDGRLFGNSECDSDWSLIPSEPGFRAASGDSHPGFKLAGDSEPTLSKQQFDRFLGHAFLSVAQVSDLKMPWEKGVFAQIFGDEQPSTQFTVPCPQPWKPVDDEGATAVQDLVSAAAGVDTATGPVFQRAISCLTDKDFHGKQAELLRIACDKWLTILSTNFVSSDVGRNILDLGPLEDHREEAHEILAAVIGVRSVNTAICRANSILKFLQATFERHPSLQMPFQEELVWRYFQQLRQTAGATSAASTLSAFRYAKYVMGIELLDQVLNSKRLKGLSEIMFAGKRKLQQALVLSVQQVRMIHAVLEDSDADPFDRASAGYMLTALYGRCRASDLIFLDNIQHDHNHREGFVELFTTVHKSSRSAAKKATLLPILAPAVGITGNNWVNFASDAFCRAGLEFHGEIMGPLLRPPSHQGPFLCKRSVTSTEVGKLLRGLIGEDIEVRFKQAPHVSAHSLKATGLAWSARFGMAWSDRAILGRHQSHTNEATAIYSRDIAVGPVTRFAGMLSEVAKGAFRPDAERSQYFAFPPVPPGGHGISSVEQEIAEAEHAGEGFAVECKTELPPQPEMDSVVTVLDSESESSDSASSGSEVVTSESDVEEPPRKLRAGARRLGPPAGSSWVCHKKSGLLHLCWLEESGGDGAKRLTACGRTVTSNFEAMTSATEGNVICVMCQRRQ